MRSSQTTSLFSRKKRTNALIIKQELVRVRLSDRLLTSIVLTDKRETCIAAAMEVLREEGQDDTWRK
jgi:hypothetical protein